MSNYRYMRSMLMFDLPVVTANQRKEYRKFLKFLKKQGFIMYQESIYVKLSINEASVKALKKTIESHLPKEGLVSMITITERQFSNIDYFLGAFQTDVVVNDQRLVEL